VRRLRGVVGLTMALLVGLTTSLRAFAPAAAPRPSRLAGIRVVNYYLSTHFWGAMWAMWDPAGMAKDFNALASLGANGVRLIISPAVFGFPVPSDLMLSRYRYPARSRRP
jgi:hypothetical protein